MQLSSLIHRGHWDRGVETTCTEWCCSSSCKQLMIFLGWTIPLDDKTVNTYSIYKQQHVVSMTTSDLHAKKGREQGWKHSRGSDIHSWNRKQCNWKPWSIVTGNHDPLLCIILKCSYNTIVHCSRQGEQNTREGGAKASCYQSPLDEILIDSR